MEIDLAELLRSYGTAGGHFQQLATQNRPISRVFKHL
jgi:hypothetical protein